MCKQKNSDMHIFFNYYMSKWWLMIEVYDRLNKKQVNDSALYF